MKAVPGVWQIHIHIYLYIHIIYLYIHITYLYIHITYLYTYVYSICIGYRRKTTGFDSWDCQWASPDWTVAFFGQQLLQDISDSETFAVSKLPVGISTFFFSNLSVSLKHLEWEQLIKKTWDWRWVSPLRHFGTTSVSVLPNIWNETWDIPIVEPMHCRLHSLSTTCVSWWWLSVASTSINVHGFMQLKFFNNDWLVKH